MNNAMSEPKAIRRCEYCGNPDGYHEQQCDAPVEYVVANVVDEMIDNLRYNVGKQKAEPKAPDVTETHSAAVEFLPMANKYRVRIGDFFESVVLEQDAIAIAAQLKAEIAARLQAEKERDASIAKLSQVAEELGCSESPDVVLTAKLCYSQWWRRIKEVQALESERDQLQRDLDEARGAIRATDERINAAGEKVDILFGCDTPDLMAEELLACRLDLDAIRESKESK